MWVWYQVIYLLKPLNKAWIFSFWLEICRSMWLSIIITCIPKSSLKQQRKLSRLRLFQWIRCYTLLRLMEWEYWELLSILYISSWLRNSRNLVSSCMMNSFIILCYKIKDSSILIRKSLTVCTLMKELRNRLKPLKSLELLKVVKLSLTSSDLS